MNMQAEDLGALLVRDSKGEIDTDAVLSSFEALLYSGSNAEQYLRKDKDFVVREKDGSIVISETVKRFEISLIALWDRDRKSRCSSGSSGGPTFYERHGFCRTPHDE